MNVTRSNGPSSRAILTGRILGYLVAAFLLLASAGPKLLRHSSATDYFDLFGFDSASVTFPIGVLEALIAILFVIPRTSVLGAILLTGLLGGAMATQLRIGEPLYFPLMVGVFAWLSLYLRDGRLREMIVHGIPGAGTGSILPPSGIDPGRQSGVSSHRVRG